MHQDLTKGPNLHNDIMMGISDILSVLTVALYYIHLCWMWWLNQSKSTFVQSMHWLEPRVYIHKININDTHLSFTLGIMYHVVHFRNYRAGWVDSAKFFVMTFNKDLKICQLILTSGWWKAHCHYFPFKKQMPHFIFLWDLITYYERQIQCQTPHLAAKNSKKKMF